MKLGRVFAFRLRVLTGHIWATLPFAAGICAGVMSASGLTGYITKTSAQPYAPERLAILMETRSIFGLIGAVWACVLLGADFERRGVNALLYRGCRRITVFATNYSLFLLGCVLCSITAQVTAFIAGGGIASLGFGRLVAAMLLRMVLDVGMCSVPTIAVYALRKIVSALCVGCIYGFALLVAYSPNYALWVSFGQGVVTVQELWQLAALVLSPALSLWLFERAELI